MRFSQVAWIWLGLLLSPLPSASSALAADDNPCIRAGPLTFWKATAENYRITILDNNRPMSDLWLRSCLVKQGSQISFPKSELCKGDVLLVDGQECTVSFVQPHLN